MRKITKKLVTLSLSALVCVVLFGMTAMAATPLKPTVLRTNFKTAGTRVAAYNLTSPITENETIIPVQITESGCVYFDFKNLSRTLAEVTLHSEKSYNDFAWRTFEIYENTTQLVEQTGIWLDKGNYYLKIHKGSVGSDEAENKEYEARLQVQMYEYSGANATMKNGKWIMTSSAGYGGSTESSVSGYYKIVVPKRGYIKVESSRNSEEYADFSFYNSKKKKIRNIVGVIGKNHGRTDYVAVKNGTYYLKMDSAGNNRIRYTFKADPDKKNYTMDTAITLKRGQVVRNVFYPDTKGMKGDRYYKIVLTKKQRVFWEGDAILCNQYGSSVGSECDDNGETIPKRN